MKTVISIIIALLFTPALPLTAYADWEIYDDFNDGDLDAGKWDTRTARGGNVSESSGYLILSAATLTEPGISPGTSAVSAANLTSRLEPEDVIAGLRMTYLISNYCDARYDVEFTGGTIFSPGGYSLIPVGYDYAMFQMMTRSLTHDSIPSDEQLITSTRITLANSDSYAESAQIETKNGMKTQIWSRFNDGDGYDDYNITDLELEAIHPAINHKHTGKWEQMTTAFGSADTVTTSTSWTNRKTHYEDPSMRLIEKNDPAGGPGFFGTANGQFSIWFNAAPKITGAVKPCKIWIDQIEVYR